MKILNGIDIVKVDRIRKAIENHGDSFCERVFSADEIDYCEGHKMKYEHYAGRFAAKEAFIKCFGLASLENLPLKEIEVVHAASGKPIINLSSEAQEALGLEEGTQIELSLSHERDYAVASVVALI